MNSVIRHVILWSVLVSVALTVAGCESGQPRRTRRMDGEERKLLVQGQRYQQEGLLESALAAFEMVLDDNPQVVDAHLGIGDIYEIRGDYDEAARNYANAKTINPGNFKAVYKLGLMYHLLNRVRDAISEYLAALAINPSNFQANLNIATAYLQIDEPQMALPYAEAAVELKPNDPNAYVNLGTVYAALGEHHLAIEQYQAALELGRLKPEIAMNMAGSLIKIGKYQRAINVLKTVLKLRPDGVVHERLGYAYFKLAQYDPSLEHYRTALDYDPDDTAALNGVGVNLMTRYLRGRREDASLRDQAIQSWQRSVRVDPSQDKIVNLIATYRKL